VTVIAGDRPVLSLSALEAFDPRAPANSAERRFCCPLPACAGKPVDATHRSLAVNATSGLWKCYRCGAAGKLREHWQPRREAQRAALHRRFAVPQQPVRRAEKPENGLAQPVTTEKPSLDWQATYGNARPLANTAGARYLAGRAIPLALAEAAGVRFAVVYGRPACLFPVHDHAGQLVALHARYGDDGRTKPGALSKQTWGAASAGVFATVPRVWERPPLAVVEAPIDALSLAVCGVGAIALMGTGYGPDWLPRALAFATVAAAFDGDAAGEAAAQRLAGRLTLGTVVRRLRPDAAKDWNALLVAGQLDTDALRAALALASPDTDAMNAEDADLCAVAGCGRELDAYDRAGRPLCRAHWHRADQADHNPNCHTCGLATARVANDCEGMI